MRVSFLLISILAFVGLANAQVVSIEAVLPNPCDYNSINAIDCAEGNFNIYPNPNVGVVNIQLENAFGISTTNVKVVDVLGSVVYENNSLAMDNTNIAQLNLKHLKVGVYFIELTINDKKITKKLIIKK